MRRVLTYFVPDAAVGNAADPVDGDWIRAGREQVPVEELGYGRGFVDRQTAACETAFMAGAGESWTPGAGQGS